LHLSSLHLPPGAQRQSPLLQPHLLLLLLLTLLLLVGLVQGHLTVWL
jgi:hypothetical protein